MKNLLATRLLEAGLVLSLACSVHAQSVEVFDTVFVPPGYPDGSLLATMFVPSVGNGIGVVLTHGSGGRRASQRPWCDTLASYGYVAMSIDYQEGATYPSEPRTAKVAVEFLRRNSARFGISTNAIVGWGMSRGAWIWGLAIPWDNDDALFGTDPLVDDHLDAAILLYGYYEDQCIPNATSIATPLLLMHGTADGVVPYQESKMLYDTLSALGKIAQLRLFEGEPHAFDLNYPAAHRFTSQGLIAKDTALSFLERIVHPALKIRPSTSYLNCENLLIASSDTFAISIDNISSTNLTIDSLEYSGEHFSLFDLSILPRTIPPKNSLTFKVSFHPMTPGIMRDTIVLASNDPLHPVLRIALRGRGVSGIAPAKPRIIYTASPEQPEGILYAMNPSSGEMVPQGPTGLPEMWGMTVRPSTKEIYTMSRFSEGARIFRVTSDSGYAVEILKVPLPRLRAIAFSRTDTLYGATSDGKLYRINPVTGDTSLIGASRGLCYSGLAFNPRGDKLWASVRTPIDSVFTLDTTNGSATFVGTTGFNALTTGIAFDHLGRLYALIDNGSGEDYLAVLDTTNASGTLVSNDPLSVKYLQGIAINADSTLSEIPYRKGHDTPEAYALTQNYPNPFNPATTFRFALPEPSNIRLEVYNTLGQIVARLFEGPKQEGFHSVTWHASEDLGSGVYFYRLTAASESKPENVFVQVRKMVVVR